MQSLCSKKLVAQGFCEAVLLALLREEQWKEKSPNKRKMEIYVLVRNSRSSVYRLALASRKEIRKNVNYELNVYEYEICFNI